MFHHACKVITRGNLATEFGEASEAGCGSEERADRDAGTGLKAFELVKTELGELKGRRYRVSKAGDETK
jgi:hypothetical protein